MKKAVVTGANGFVGSAVVKALSVSGYETYAVVRKNGNAENIEQLPNVHIVRCDLCEMASLPSLIQERGFSVFYHFAWAGTSGAARSDYALQLRNVRAACEAAEAANEIECGKFIFASSIMAYECIKVMESDPLPASGNIYSTAKLAADFMARTVAAAKGIPYISAVISNIYGPGEYSPRLVNTTIRKILNGEKTVFSDGTQTYDFIYIDDAAQAFLAMAESGKVPRGGAYYVGSSRPAPLKEFLLELGKAVNPDVRLGIGKADFKGICLDYSMFDIDALRRDTGFTPSYSFYDGIKKTTEWIRKTI